MSKITKSAQGMDCIRCGSNDGTVCARHYNGPRQYSYGKGRGIKCNDLMTAEFCSKCDFIFTEGETRRWANNVCPWLINDSKKLLGLSQEGSIELFKDLRSGDFLHWINMTNIRRIETGQLFWPYTW